MEVHRLGSQRVTVLHDEQSSAPPLSSRGLQKLVVGQRRYDRDERSQGVADVFVVPKYLKITKANPAGKPAVAMTKHGKDLTQR